VKILCSNFEKASGEEKGTRFGMGVYLGQVEQSPQEVEQGVEKGGGGIEN